MLNTQLKLQKLNRISRTNIVSSGFTLIELLVVIVILAILAVAVIVAINPAQRISAANNSTIQSNEASWGSSAASYAAQNGGYPTNWAATGGSGTAGAAWTIGTGASGAVYTVSGVAYTYAVNPSSCNATTTPCTDVSISAPVNTGDGHAGIWCFQSKTGTVTNVTGTSPACAP